MIIATILILTILFAPGSLGPWLITDETRSIVALEQ